VGQQGAAGGQQGGSINPCGADFNLILQCKACSVRSARHHTFADGTGDST